MSTIKTMRAITISRCINPPPMFNVKPSNHRMAIAIAMYSNICDLLVNVVVVYAYFIYITIELTSYKLF